jgi:oligopeptide transport system permease protein
MPYESAKLLTDMKTAVDRIFRFTTDRTFDDFVNDDLLRSGVERQFEIVGEAMTRLRQSFPDVARITCNRRAANVLPRLELYAAAEKWMLAGSMTALALPESPIDPTDARPESEPSRVWRNARVLFGGGLLLLILLACLATLPATLREKTADRPASNYYYNQQHQGFGQQPPRWSPGWQLLGTTKLGQSLIGRCGIGGVISLTVGIASAIIAVALGVTVGLVAGYAGGWVDHLLMRAIEVLDCLPYILMVILLKLSLPSLIQGKWIRAHLYTLSDQSLNLIVLFVAIGGVSWLTMARVIRGQVLSLRGMPFVDAARAVGTPWHRIFANHLLPNLIGPITVYATLTIPSAILQESTLSFLGIGVQPPLPTWGSLASEGLSLALNPISSRWWLLLFPCILLAVTLISLNFLGDGLRDAFDPRRRASQV